MLASELVNSCQNEFHGKKMLLTNFPSFIVFFYPSHSKDLIQDLESVGVAELLLAVMGNFLQLIYGNTKSSKLLDDMN
jgi:hypothetical protein